MFRPASTAIRRCGQLHRIRTQTKRLFTTRTTQTPLSTGGYVSHLEFIREGDGFFYLDLPSIECLTTDLEKKALETELRGLFLRSTIAGTDLECLQSIRTPEAAEHFVRSMDKLCSTIQDFPVPVTAVIKGPCAGVGMEVAASCDIRLGVQDKSTIFGMLDTKIGVPSMARASLLPSLIGWGNAKQMLCFNLLVSANKIESWGFLNQLVVEKDLEFQIGKVEGRLAAAEPNAVRLQKKMIRMWEEKGTGREGIEAGFKLFAEAFREDKPQRTMEMAVEDRARKKRDNDAQKEEYQRRRMARREAPPSWM